MNCCHESLKCEWLQRGRRKVFSLSPLAVRGGDTGIKREGLFLSRGRVSDSSFVLVASFDNSGTVRRLRGSVGTVEREALRLADHTGDCVVIGRQVGLDAHDLPLFESVGRVLTAKADPLSAEALESWAEQLTANMLKVSRADLAVMTTEALDHLAIDYGAATVPQIERAFQGYRTTIGTPNTTMLRAQRVEVSRTLRRVLRAVGIRTRQFPAVRSNLASGFAVRDRDVSRLLSRHHSFFVRDNYGRISNSMSQRARAIIASGVDRGLGRDEIARELAQMTGKGVRSEAYYRTVAGVHVARGRSYSLGASFRAAGIEYFRIEAVLDDRTTHQCQFLHKKILPVGASMGHITRTMNDPRPEAVLSNQPFIVDEGNKLTIPTAGGGSATVATISDRGTGAGPSGTPASFSSGMSQSEMVSAAIGFPPYHFGCRTTVVPA